MAPSHNPKLTLIKGALWAVGTRWSIKGIGFLNTVIMARLLLPADYGVVAMAMLAVGLIQAFMDLGVGTALLRKKEVHRDDADSAWTLRIMQSVVVAMALIGVSPWVSVYFGEPRVQTILWVMALGVVLEGASNIGMVLAQKAFNFSLEFRVNVASKTISVLATLVSGYFLRDYRALVIGVMAGYCSTFVLSYWLNDYRPRWNTRKVREIWAVTKWLMLASIGTFLIRRSDELIAGRVGTTGEYGTYHVGADLGRLPVGELGPSLLRAFLPVLSSMKSDIQRTNQAVLKALTAANTITLPIGFGVAAVALPVTELILGNNWLAAAPYVAGFALVASAQFSISPLNSLLVLHGHTKTQSSVVWIELVAFAISAVLLLPRLHLMGLVWSRLIAMAVSALATVNFAHNLCGMPWRSILLAFWRPLLGSVAMYFVVGQAMQGLAGNAVQLVAGVAAGAAAYVAWSLASWRLSGRPDGLESTVLEALRSVRRKFG